MNPILKYIFLATGLDDDDRPNKDPMTEEWRSIAGYEGFYEVSNFGNVRSCDKYVNATRGSKALRKGRVLEKTEIAGGYQRVCLSREHVKEYESVHRLVALAFIPLRDGADFVNHKDLNKKNNRVDNLEWVTQSENNQHAHDAGAYAEGNNLASKNKNVARKLTPDEVAEIRKLATERSMSQTKIAEKFGIHQSMVSYLKSRKTWREPGEGKAVQ
jgi:predicted XRE-type DNA-binding protein